MKLRGVTTKYILRRAMQGLLPEEILSRKKMGFPVPVGAWLRGAHRTLVDEYVLSERALGRGLFEAAAVREMTERHLRGEENHSERLWALVNLEVWHRLFLDAEPAEEIGAATFAPGAAARVAMPALA
jgi:asparagine synthase (glutamine-hydrolysing)